MKEKGEYFYSYVTKRQYKVKQNVNCQSKNAIYLITCKKSKKQGVGERISFKSRMANYISCIKNQKKMPSNIDKHFIAETNHSIEDFDVQIIAQLEDVPHDKYQVRKQFEGYWHGLNQ